LPAAACPQNVEGGILAVQITRARQESQWPPAAWVERSETQDVIARAEAAPDFTSFNPGYACYCGVAQ
jgi:hypothetical protein